MFKPSNPETTAARLRKLTALRPTLAMVLGSGFGGMASQVKIDSEISYARLPGFPPAGVSGHAGKLLFGHLGSTAVMVLQGRAHYYEGHSMFRVTFPIRVMAEFGIKALLLTNAAGAINHRFRVGDFMCLTDHINLMGENPLRGVSVNAQTRFVDLTEAYDHRLIALLRKAAAKSRVRLHSGVYLAVAGSSYETPAEILAFARLGADAIGMSTVPEVMVARQCGLAVAALSCLTNRAAGLSRQGVSHAEVLATGEKVKPQAARLLKYFAEGYANSDRGFMAEAAPTDRQQN